MFFSAGSVLLISGEHTAPSRVILLMPVASASEAAVGPVLSARGSSDPSPSPSPALPPAHPWRGSSGGPSAVLGGYCGSERHSGDVPVHTWDHPAVQCPLCPSHEQPPSLPWHQDLGVLGPWSRRQVSGRPVVSRGCGEAACLCCVLAACSPVHHVSNGRQETNRLGRCS